MKLRTIVVSGTLALALALVGVAEATQVVSDRATPCLNMRSAPGQAAIACLVPGEQVDVLERAAEWGRVRLADGREGWLHLGFLQPTASLAAATSLRLEASIGATRSVPLGGNLLYDQLDSPAGSGFASQDFDAANSQFDCRAADDFTVPPADIQWDVAGLRAFGTYINGTGLTPQINVEFLADAGGVPGAVACSYSGLQLGPDYADDGTGNLSITLPSICSLPAGTYWVSVQADMDSTVGGQWLWAQRSAPAGSPFAWENPPDGFGTGCTAWTPAGVCGASESDLLFAVLGQMVPVELQTFSVD